MSLQQGLLVALLTGAFDSRDPRPAGASPALPPEAALHNQRGVAFVTAGDYDAAVEALLQAYAAMPDPAGQRSGRGKVLGSLRGALHRLYTDTGDVQHLCRLQTLLREHIEALLIALGAAARPEDVAGSLGRLREVDDEVGARCSPAPRPTHVAVTLLPPRPARRDPPPAPEAPPLPASPRALAATGTSLLVLGVGSLGAMTVGIVLHADSRNKLQSLAARLAAGEEIPLAEIDSESARLYDRGRDMRTMAIVGGILGGATLVAGAALRGVFHRRVQRARVTPTYGAGQFGLHLHTTF